MKWSGRNGVGGANVSFVHQLCGRSDIGKATSGLQKPRVARLVYPPGLEKPFIKRSDETSANAIPSDHEVALSSFKSQQKL